MLSSLSSSLTNTSKSKVDLGGPAFGGIRRDHCRNGTCSVHVLLGTAPFVMGAWRALISLPPAHIRACQLLPISPSDRRADGHQTCSAHRPKVSVAQKSTALFMSSTHTSTINYAPLPTFRPRKNWSPAPESNQRRGGSCTRSDQRATSEAATTKWRWRKRECGQRGAEGRRCKRDDGGSDVDGGCRGFWGGRRHSHGAAEAVVWPNRAEARERGGR